MTQPTYKYICYTYPVLGIFWGFRAVVSMLLVELKTITCFGMLGFFFPQLENWERADIQKPQGTYLSKRTASPSQIWNHGATKGRHRATGDSNKKQGNQYRDKHRRVSRQQVPRGSSTRGWAGARAAPRRDLSSAFPSPMPQIGTA